MIQAVKGTPLKGVPPQVEDFCQSVLGTRVVFVSPVNSFDGIVRSTSVDGKRIKYTIQQPNGSLRTAYADQVAHTWVKEDEQHG